jgi:broad specificity phosphatase PhoE
MADEVWLVRHAETEWSRTGRHTGRTDIPLTDIGRDVAWGPLRARLDGHAFALVLCSPLTRARDTAQLAGLECSGLRDDLLEWDYGEYEGITTPEIREQRPSWYLWHDGAPGGESPDDVAARCDRVIAEAHAVDGDVALVAHGHILRALSARWVEEPVAFGGRLHLGTGSISVLGYEREVACIKLWNG